MKTNESLPAKPLTKREAEIAKLLASGLTCPQVAERLCLSQHTVKTHCRNIYTKLCARSRIELNMALTDSTVSTNRVDIPTTVRQE